MKLLLPTVLLLLLLGANAVRGAEFVVWTPNPNASCACPSACAISASLKYSFSSSSAPSRHLPAATKTATRHGALLLIQQSKNLWGTSNNLEEKIWTLVC